jgi:hypothetical protein
VISVLLLVWAPDKEAGRFEELPSQSTRLFVSVVTLYVGVFASAEVWEHPEAKSNIEINSTAVILKIFVFIIIYFP